MKGEGQEYLTEDEITEKIEQEIRETKEYAIDRKTKLVYDIEVNGEEITEADYKDY